MSRTQQHVALMLRELDFEERRAKQRLAPGTPMLARILDDIEKRRTDLQKELPSNAR